MRKSTTFSLAAVAILSLFFFLAVLIRDKKELLLEKKRLILKNDSLHNQLLETREKVAALTTIIDSLSR